MRRTLRAAVFALLGFSAALAPRAEASTTVHVVEVNRPIGAQIVIVGDNRANRIMVGWDDQARVYELTDRRLIVAPDCDRVSPLQVRCPSAESGLDGVRGVTVYGRRGDDEIDYLPSLPPGRRGYYISGGKGSDLLDGGPGEDDLIGNHGNDRLFGRGGDDYIVGESDSVFYHAHPGRDLISGGPGNDYLGSRYEVGLDRFFGGSGRDSLNAHDTAEDMRIDAGRGGDRCRYDRFDPKPIDCERTHRITPPQDSPWDRAAARTTR